MDVISACCRDEEEMFFGGITIILSTSFQWYSKGGKSSSDFQSRKKFIADFDCYFEGGVYVLSKWSAVKVKQVIRILSSFKVAELYILSYPLHSHSSLLY